MKKLLVSICLLVSVATPSSDRFRNYHAVKAYAIRPGIIMTPFYATNGDLCEISIEKRHYSDNRVDMDAAMPEEQIISMFDELVPEEERGGLKFNLPPGSEMGESDFGMLTTFIPYKNVTLLMDGKKDRPDRQKYIAAIISWNKQTCKAK